MSFIHKLCSYKSDREHLYLTEDHWNFAILVAEDLLQLNLKVLNIFQQILGVPSFFFILREGFIIFAMAKVWTQSRKVGGGVRFRVQTSSETPFTEANILNPSLSFLYHD